MNLPEFGVRRPVTNLMIFCAILILAFYSLTRIGIDMFPEIEPPVISVISSYPGASPEDVEIRVTQELENHLGTTPGLEKITSSSTQGVSMISLKFVWGTNLAEATNDVRDRIDLAKRFLPDIPDEMDNPFIFKFNTANIPILFAGVTAQQSYSELYDLMDKTVGDALRQLPGVGTVQFQGGGLERQINIWVDKAKLESYGFSVLDIGNVLRQENITEPIGNLKSGLTDYLIHLPGEFNSPEEINSVILGKREGHSIYLKDVARVEDGFKEVKTTVRINKARGIMMMVQKQSGTNTVAVASLVKKRLKELEKNLPGDVKVNIIFDTSKDIINSLDNLKSSVWLAVFLVVFVVWFFLRKIAPSIVIALTIPFSLLVSFIYLFLSGKTINVIGLSALAIASGMVVDNAIVIVDNIVRHLERGKRAQEAAIFGASEMFLAILASTLTTVVVFTPMLFIPGVVGIMFGELAVIVIVTLLASLFTAVTFSPMLCSKWMKSKQQISVSKPLSSLDNKRSRLNNFYEISERMFKSWEESYAKALFWCLGHKKTIVFGFLGIFISSLFLLRFVGNEFIPEEDSGDLRVTAHLAIGTRLEETDKVAQRIENIIGESVPEAKYCFARSGEIPGGMGRAFGQISGSNIALAGAKLVPKQERKRSVSEIAQVVRNKIKEIPGVLRADISMGNPIGRLITGGGGKSVQLEIIGHSFSETDAVASQIKGILERIPGTVDVSVSREANRPELKIEVDREKASVLGLNMNTVATNIKTFIQGSAVSKYRERGKTYDIYVRLEESSRGKIEDIANLSVISASTGQQIKLSNIARIYETAVPEEIARKNRERVVIVECNAYKRSPGKIIEDLKKEMERIVVPEGVTFNIGGEAEEQRKAFSDMTLLLILGVALVYMVMAAQFESLLEPFIIMFSIPFTFTGVILGFILTKTTLSVVTFLGIVMLMGIVVNNAIVLISYINILRARGLSMLEAVTVGGKERLRPVLMTTITTLVGLLPLALSRGEGSETWQPLGITMFGGLTVSTFVTMLFVPTLYAIFESRFRKNGGKNK